MPKKLTQEEFIRRATEKHGGRYDYSKVQYVNGTTPVIIICPEHGEFSIKPQKHLAGQGCKPCGYIRNRTTIRKTTEYFIERARKKHGDKYDYSRVVYKGADDPVEIICPRHGSFWQRPASHTYGCGCNKCAVEDCHTQQRKSVKQFVADAKSVHGEIYDYSQIAEYKNRRTRLPIICRTHGVFMQSANDHLQGHGCPKCADEVNAEKRSMGTAEFIRRAKAIHGDRYDYSEVDYKSNNAYVVIICPQHGRFRQIAGSHLQGKGCSKCKSEKQKCPVVGIGTNDLLGTEHLKSYKIWQNMLLRCYSEKWRQRTQSYADCSVCDEWLTFSNFKKWFDENYVEGYQLDKDLMHKGAKVYSPENCNFVPQYINTLTIKGKKVRGDYPIGVTKYGNRYVAAMSKKGSRCTRIAVRDTPEEAFLAYKQTKEAYIKEVATEYYNRGEITKRVYDALMRWEVEITD